MARFEEALEFVLAAEGSEFVDDPADSGSASKGGISIRFLREIPIERLKRYGIFGIPTADDVQQLTIDQIRLIYEREFWLHVHFEKLYDQKICNYIFSMCVLHGLAQGIKILQRATWAVMENCNYCEDDGIMGDYTLANVNSMLASSALRGELTAALMAEHAGFFRMLAEVRPKDRRFLDGWLERCYKI